MKNATRPSDCVTTAKVKHDRHTTDLHANHRHSSTLGEEPSAGRLTSFVGRGKYQVE